MVLRAPKCPTCGARLPRAAGEVRCSYCDTVYIGQPEETSGRGTPSTSWDERKLLLVSGGASVIITLGIALHFLLSSAERPSSPPPPPVTVVPPTPVASVPPLVSPPPPSPPPREPSKPERKPSPQEWLSARMVVPNGRESREWCMAQELARRPDAARSYRITLHFNEQLDAEEDKSRVDPEPSVALKHCLHHHLSYAAVEALREAMPASGAPKRGPVDVTVNLRFPNVKPAEKLDDRFR